MTKKLDHEAIRKCCADFLKRANAWNTSLWSMDVLDVISDDEKVTIEYLVSDGHDLTRELLEENETLQSEVERLKGDIQCMVNKAAENKLDGYRELGARAAAAESRAEKAERELEEARHANSAYADAAIELADKRAQEAEAKLVDAHKHVDDLLEQMSATEKGSTE